MMDTNHNLGRSRQLAVTRRRVLTRGLLGMAGIGAATAIGCGAKPQPQQAPSTAPAGPSASETPVPGGTLHWYLTGNPTGLDTHENARYWTQYSVGAVQSRLLQFKVGPDPKQWYEQVTEGDLATSVESPDAITWTVKLRRDAKFQNVPPVNGHPVEAEDVKATFTRALTDPKNANRGVISMIDPAQIEAPSADTVIFKLKYAYAPFRTLLASPTYSWIFPREVLTGAYDPNKEVIGSGPFLFEKYTPDVDVTFKRNPAWFRKGRPYLDGLRFAILPNPAQEMAQFTAGNLEQVAVPVNDLETMKRNTPAAALLTLAPAPIPGMVFGQLGDSSSVWQDIRVRRAVSLAIDRNALAKVKAPTGGEAQLIIPVSFGKWALRPEDLPPDTAQWYKYDPKQARQLLQAAGRQDFPFKFIYTNNGYGPAFNTAAETIHSMLSAGGFNAALVTIDYAKDYVAGGKGIRYGSAPPDALTDGIIAPYSDADEIIFNYFDSASRLSNTRVKDPDLDAMIAKERAITNEGENVKAILDIQKYLAEKLYLVAGMADPHQYLMVQPWVKHYTYSGDYGIATEAFSQVWIQK